MTDPPADEAPDRIVIRLDAGGPIEVGDLTGSFAALARLYERHYRHDGDPAPKLYITRLETGSIIAEITPLIVLLGAVVTAMDQQTVLEVVEFRHRHARQQERPIVHLRGGRLRQNVIQQDLPHQRDHQPQTFHLHPGHHHLQWDHLVPGAVEAGDLAEVEVE